MADLPWWWPWFLLALFLVTQRVGEWWFDRKENRRV